MTSHQPPGNLTEASLTILRCSWFDQNFSENYLLEPILDGLVESPGRWPSRSSTPKTSPMWPSQP